MTLHTALPIFSGIIEIQAMPNYPKVPEHALRGWLGCCFHGGYVRGRALPHSGLLALGGEEREMQHGAKVAVLLALKQLEAADRSAAYYYYALQLDLKCAHFFFPIGTFKLRTGIDFSRVLH